MDERQAWRERFRARLHTKARAVPPPEHDPNPAVLIAEAAKRKRPAHRSYDDTRSWGVTGERAYRRIQAEHAARRKAIAERGAQVCSKCGRDQPLSEYPRHKTAHGETRYEAQCRACQRARQQASKAAKRAAANVSPHG